MKKEISNFDMNEGTVLTINRISSSSSFCSLPRSVSSTLVANDLTCIRIESPNLTIPLFLPWIGAISSHSKNSLEVPHNLLLNTGLKDGEFVTIHLITHLNEAKEVLLSCKSEFDWEIVSTQAVYIEQNLLKSLSFVYPGQDLKINISSSLHATLKVKSINFRNGSMKKGKRETVDIEVAKINNSTSLIIEPFIPKEKSLKPTSQSVTDSKKQVPEDIIKSSSYEKHTDLYLLRVLPQGFRTSDTSFFGLNNNTTLNLKNGIKDFSRDLAVELDEEYLNKFLEDENNSGFCEKQSGFDQENEKKRLFDDSVTCFIHPLFLKNSYEIAHGFDLVRNEWDKLYRILKKQTFKGLITALDGTGTNKPISKTALVSVQVSPFIRPGFVSIPGNVRKGLHLTDFNCIRLEFITSRITNPVIPSTITLTPVYWNTPEPSPQKSNGVSTKHHKLRSKNDSLDLASRYTLGDAEGKVAFLRCLEQLKSSNENGKITEDAEVLLYDGQVLSLLQTSQQNNTTNILRKDSVTQPSSNPLLDNITASQDPMLKFIRSQRAGIVKYVTVDYLVSIQSEEGSGVAGGDKDSISLRIPKYSCFRWGVENDEQMVKWLNALEFNFKVPITAKLDKTLLDTGEISNVSSSFSRPHSRDKISSHFSTRTGRHHFASPVGSQLPLKGISYSSSGTSKSSNQISRGKKGKRETTGSSRKTTVHPFSGFERVATRIIMNLSTSLLPVGVFSRVDRVIRPTGELLLTGPPGSGKTTILQEISGFLKESPRSLIQCSYLDGDALRFTPVDQLLQKLTGVFIEAISGGPSIVFIDNIDKLCPSANETGVGTLRDEKSAVICLHLERLLLEVRGRKVQSHEAALALRMLFKDRRKETNNVSEHLSDFEKEVIVGRALHETVSVIASAESISSLQSSLISSSGFREIIQIPSLDKKSRETIFLRVLQDLGVSLDDTSGKFSESFSTLTEGYRVCDLSSLAKNTSSLVYRRICRSIQQNQNSLNTTVDHSPLHLGLISPGQSQIVNTTASSLLKMKQQHTPQSTISNSDSEYLMSRTGESTGFDAYSVSWVDIKVAAEGFTPISSSLQSSSHSVSNNVTWQDVGGYEEVRKQIHDTIQLPLIYQRLYQLSPVKIPRAVLLFGPPGCGKTFIAQAAGKDFGVGFISVRGPQLLDKYIGASEKAVRELFQRARDTGRPSLLFFDEFESLGAKRGKDNTGVTDRIVNQLLTFIDGVEASMGSNKKTSEDEEGFNGNGQVFLMAATSRPDLVDAALLRPGRIEKHIYVGLPDEKAAKSILMIGLSKLNVSADIEETVDEIVSGELERAVMSKRSSMTSADWRAVVNTAFLNATNEHILTHQQQLLNTENRCINSISSCAYEESPKNMTNVSDQNVRSLTVSPVATLNSSQGVEINGEHLKRSFQETRPSISAADMEFYTSIHNKFMNSKMKKKVNEDLDEINKQKVAFH